MARDVDVVVDTRGGDDFLRLLKTLRPGGIIATILGRQPGQEDAVSSRGLRAGFTYVRPNAAHLRQVGERFAEGSARVHSDRRFPLEGAAEAHAIGERGHVRGLLILDVR